MGIAPLLNTRKNADSFMKAGKYLLSSPSAWSELPQWSASLFCRIRRTEIGIVANPQPCFTFGALNWLGSTIQSDWRVFEWGSGASTLYFARLCQHVTAVEHHTAWGKLVGEKLQEINPCAHLLIHEPKEDDSLDSDSSFASVKLPRNDFSEYIQAIGDEEGGTASYDLVVIDGRSRVACAGQAIKHIKPGGYLILAKNVYEKS